MSSLGRADSTMILFRTHQDTPRIRERFDYLTRTAGLDVVCVFDDSNESGFEGKPHVSINSGVFEQLGLGNDSRMAWRCGDYCYYAARAAYPSIKHFWLVEYDVMFSFKEAAEFFSRFDAVPEIDFLAGRVMVAPEWWGWGKTMDPAEGPVYRSFFPVTRLSARGVDHCLEARRSLFSSFQNDPDEWPNDEVFVPTVLARDGYRIADLNDIAKTYRRDTFNFFIPRNYEKEIQKVRGSLLHPVLDAQEIASKPHSTLPRTPLHALKRYFSVWVRG